MLLVAAVCAKCGGTMRERADKGAFSKAPLGRLWTYECDNCGRTKTLCAPVTDPETIAQYGFTAKEMGVR